MLLQGLTLTLHCGSLDRPLQLGHGMAAGDLIAILQPSLGKWLTNWHGGAAVQINQ